ncbi:MAG: hypothetical protein GXY43_01660 [Clostridiaceae bacterium]|nr:hypothetical protein [Clostridiaceae bacterium]
MAFESETNHRTAFGYSMNPEREVGFYVVCSDRMILDNINSLMRKRGMVGISDTAGRLHYLVDARTGVPSAVKRITGQALKGLDHSSLSNAQLLQGVENVLDRYFLDRILLGTRIARYMLVQSVRDPSLMSAVTKRLYPMAGKEFGISASQVERNLRYAFRKMRLFEEGRRNVYILRKLFDEVTALLVRNHDCIPYPASMSI